MSWKFQRLRPPANIPSLLIHDVQHTFNQPAPCQLMLRCKCFLMILAGSCKHLSVLDHAQLQGVHAELSIQVGLYAPAHALKNHQICIACLLNHLQGHLHAEVMLRFPKTCC